jgi:hypothetical protein
MTETHIQLIDDLGLEFGRVAAERRRRAPRRGFAVAIACAVLALLGAGAYAVPPTRAAIEDLTSSFAGWVAGDESDAPGRALRPGDDAPDWVRDEGGRLIVEKGDVQLYVTRSETVNGTYLNFVLDRSVSVGNTVDGWRETFDDRAAIVLGPALLGPRDILDDHGRYPLLGVTARSVERVEVTYADAPPVVEAGLDGGFILLLDAWRLPLELIAYDAGGRELDRVDLTYLDTRYFCEKEPACPPH